MTYNNDELRATMLQKARDNKSILYIDRCLAVLQQEKALKDQGITHVGVEGIFPSLYDEDTVQALKDMKKSLELELKYEPILSKVLFLD